MIVWGEDERAYGLYERGADRLTWYRSRAKAEAAALARAGGREPPLDGVWLPAYCDPAALMIAD